MGNSKIEYFGETLIDLTKDTVSSDKVFEGVTAHDKAGDQITGTFTIDQELLDQESIISQMASALVGKARTYSGGGGGGANIVSASGSFTPSETTEAITITHGLGVVPDLLIVRCNTFVGEKQTQYALTSSAALYDKAVTSSETFDTNQQFYTVYLNIPMFGGLVNITPAVTGHDLSEWDSNAVVTQAGLQRNITTTSFVFGGGTLYSLAESSYSWVAIGGLV